jgi:cyclic pyranopterin phosphate synthase
MAGNELNHLDDQGAARMVDVGDKAITRRRAVARGRVCMSAAAIAAASEGSAKGEVLQVARIAGIMAAKKTSDLIPLCHPLPLDSVTVDLWIDSGESAVLIEAMAATSGRTGVEMEALVAVSVAALTVYDMLKAVDRSMVIDGIALHEKDGGRSGHYQRAVDG